MKVVDIANEIYIDNGSPSETSIPAIAFWIRGRVGWLNTMLFEDVYINDALELYVGSSPIGLEIISIIKQAYRVYDLEVQVRNSMNLLATDSVLSIKDNLAGTSFTKVNRNEIAKTLISLRKEESAFLKSMIDAYRSLKSQPSQVAGDDTMVGAFVPFPYYYPRSIRRY